MSRAEAILGYNLSELTSAELIDNKYSQMDFFVRSVILVEMYQATNQKISFVAGHSLGQYAACVAAGGLSFEDGLLLVQSRGKFMSEAIKNHLGAMVACVGPGVTDLIREMVPEFSKLYLANYNSSQQIVVSGDAHQVDELILLAKSKGVRCVKLGVSGAFHSPFMSTANELMNPLVAQANFQDTEIGFISNKSGKILRSQVEFKDEFEDQIILPVHWTTISQTIATLVEQEGLEVFEIGHGNTLAKLLQQETGIMAKSL